MITLQTYQRYDFLAIFPDLINFLQALYLAERKARDAIQVRGQIRKELNLKEKEAKESELRKLAINAKKRNFSDSELDK